MRIPIVAHLIPTGSGSARRSLLAVATIVFACGGASNATDRGGTFALREFGPDGVLPVTFHDDLQYRLDLTSGTLTLREDHTFNLQLDFDATINRQTSKVPWHADGTWSITAAQEFALHSADFGEDDPAQGLFTTIGDRSLEVANGILHPGLAVILAVRFRYLDGITYGIDAYTFQ
jgi:hypothetical protein